MDLEVLKPHLQSHSQCFIPSILFQCVTLKSWEWAWEEARTRIIMIVHMIIQRQGHCTKVHVCCYHIEPGATLWGMNSMFAHCTGEEGTCLNKHILL